jgi:hypothetical protein
MSKGPSNRDYFLAWLGCFASATIGGALLGAMIGGATGAFLHLQGVKPEDRVYVIGALTLVGTAILSFFLFRYFVRRLVRATVMAIPNA